MRRKLVTLIAALLLILTTSVTPVKVAAQGLVEYALILVVVGVGENETVETYWGNPSSSQGKPQGHGPIKNLLLYQPNILIVTKTDDATCTQSIQIEELEIAHEGLTVHSISKGFGFVSFQNEDVVELEDPCFKDPQNQRIVIQVGVNHGDRRFKFSDNNSPFPAKVPVPYPVMGYSIVGQDGRTVASVFSLTTLPNEREFK